MPASSSTAPTDPAWKDLQQGYVLGARLDYAANHIVWLTPARASNAWALAVRRDVARAHQLASLSDFGRWVAGGGQVMLACSAEFANAGTLRSLERTYGFTLRSDQMIVLAGGETSATIGAAAARTNGTNTAMVYGTDGGIAAADLLLLEDDRHDQPIYAPVPMIREAVLRQYPQIATIVKPLMESLHAREPAAAERARADRRRVRAGGRRGLPEEAGPAARRTMSAPAAAPYVPAAAPRLRPDALGVLLTAVGVLALFGLPFVLFKANRILPGEPRSLLAVLPAAGAFGCGAALLLAALAGGAGARCAVAARRRARRARGAGTGRRRGGRCPDTARQQRGTRRPRGRVLGAAAVPRAARDRCHHAPAPRPPDAGAAAGGVLRGHGPEPRARHLRSPVGHARVRGEQRALLRASCCGTCGWRSARSAPRWWWRCRSASCAIACRACGPGCWATLNVIQTVPSIALFGILMAPLAALATAWPWAAALGVHGIGAAPAAVALFLYSLLPVVANTAAGLGRVSRAAVEAAHGMGMTALAGADAASSSPWRCR